MGCLYFLPQVMVNLRRRNEGTFCDVFIWWNTKWAKYSCMGKTKRTQNIVLHESGMFQGYLAQWLIAETTD